MKFDWIKNMGVLVGMFFGMSGHALAYDIPGLGGGGSFGTKFACCQAESVSCLGGGGGTVYHLLLRDRALTQVDAKARCGFSQMRWATHSCPADVPCSNDVESSAPQLHARVCNQSGDDIWLSFAIRTYNGDKLTFGWKKLIGGQCKNYQDSRWSNGKILYVNAKYSDGGLHWPAWDTNLVSDLATFCQASSQRHEYVDVDTCHNNTPGYRFTNYGRVSGIDSFTFR